MIQEQTEQRTGRIVMAIEVDDRGFTHEYLQRVWADLRRRAWLAIGARIAEDGYRAYVIRRAPISETDRTQYSRYGNETWAVSYDLSLEDWETARVGEHCATLGELEPVVAGQHQAITPNGRRFEREYGMWKRIE